VEDLDENSLLRYFCYFVKTSEAQEFLKLQLDYLLLVATSFHPQIDGWLGLRDENYFNGHALTSFSAENSEHYA